MAFHQERRPELFTLAVHESDSKHIIFIMTKYEWFRWFTFPLLPVLPNLVRKDLSRLIKNSKSSKQKLKLLDVGGRKSPYTIGIDAEVTLLDIPQENETQQQLNLGFTEKLLKEVRANRSNIKDLIFMDMTKSTLAETTYDGVVCVEVLEHITDDVAFVENISKVLKKGGWAYFTTPNGDFIKNEGPDKNPDHIRHYTKQQLQNLLSRHFEKFEVRYAVRTGKNRVAGLRSFAIKRPYRTLTSIKSNMINKWESRNVEEQAERTAHLVALAHK